MSSSLQFSSARSLARPCPLTSFAGFISTSNSINLAIHLLFLPSMSGWRRTSLTELEGTKAITFA